MYIVYHTHLSFVVYFPSEKPVESLTKYRRLRASILPPAYLPNCMSFYLYISLPLHVGARTAEEQVIGRRMLRMRQAREREEVYETFLHPNHPLYSNAYTLSATDFRM